MHRRQKRGQGGNPQTGPFFVQGAEPGDTLVVHLLKLEPNRNTGYSGTLLAPYTADPFLPARRSDRANRRASRGRSMGAKGIAYIESSDFKPGRIELPLRPMLGCDRDRPCRQGGDSDFDPG